MRGKKVRGRPPGGWAEKDILFLVWKAQRETFLPLVDLAPGKGVTGRKMENKGWI